MAHAILTHGLCFKWNYVLCVIDLDENNSMDLLQKLENTVTSTFVPALTGQPPPGELIRDLLALPCKLGGLGITNPIHVRSNQ